MSDAPAEQIYTPWFHTPVLRAESSPAGKGEWEIAGSPASQARLFDAAKAYVARRTDG
jgi:hypothetical protein